MAPLEVSAQASDRLEPPLGLERIEHVVRWVLEAEGLADAEISVALVSDAEIARLNQEYLSHEGATDVIAFPLHRPGDPPLGDVYIGLEQALRQSRETGTDEGEEVLRLAVHGTLHVLGYEHPEEGERESSPMYLRQEELLASFRAHGGR